MTYVMGIDLGSTSLKAIIFDLEGRTIAAASRPTELSHLDPDHPTWAFWEPQKIWSGTAEAIREAVEKCDRPERIKGVAVTGFGMDGVPMDENGQWLYPFISWHCPRTEPQSRLFSEKVGAGHIFSVSGKQVLSIDTIYRLMWMNEHYPEIPEKTDKWLLIEDFINFMLCGRKATDFSMASCTSVLDQRNGTWSGELIKQAGVDIRLFPEVLPSGTFLGEVHEQAARATGLPQGTPVILGGHDYLCSALAVGAFKPDVVMDITGTWEIIVQSSEKPNLSPEVFNAGLTVDSHVARNTFATIGSAISADMLEWFRRHYAHEEKAAAQATGISDWELLMQRVEAVSPGANGVYFLPHFGGAGSPINDNRSLGAFIGLSNTAEKGHMLRAMIEGLNYQSREILDSLESALKVSPGKIVAVGGVVRNSFWMQNKADITGKVIEIAGEEESTALGAAILAGIGTGLYRDENDAYEKTFRQGKTYYPDSSVGEKYSRYYEIYKQIYPALKGVNGRIFNEFRL
jgi:sugar (pentulose or hexulose) kinase